MELLNRDVKGKRISSSSRNETTGLSAATYAQPISRAAQINDKRGTSDESPDGYICI